MVEKTDDQTFFFISYLIFIYLSFISPTQQFYNIHKLANHFTHEPTIIYNFLNDRLIWEYCEFYCVFRLFCRGNY